MFGLEEITTFEVPGRPRDKHLPSMGKEIDRAVAACSVHRLSTDNVHHRRRRAERSSRTTMKTISSFAPTWRELILLAALLVTLLLFAPENRPFTAISPRVPGLKVDNAALYDEEDFSSETGLAAVSKYPEPELKWSEGSVPETKVLQHMPGEWHSSRFPLSAEVFLEVGRHLRGCICSRAPSISSLTTLRPYRNRCSSHPRDTLF